MKCSWKNRDDNQRHGNLLGFVLADTFYHGQTLFAVVCARDGKPQMISAERVTVKVED
jgi:hypothetical protein